MRTLLSWTLLLPSLALADAPLELGGLTVVEHPAPPVSTPGPDSCTASVRLGADGVPRTVNVSGCDDAHVEATRAALSSWRWAPFDEPLDADVPLRVAFDEVGAARVSAAGQPVLHHLTAQAPPSSTDLRTSSIGDGMLTQARPSDEIQLVKRVPPELPQAARGIEAGRHVCVALVVLKRTGAPEKVTVQGCDPALHAATSEAVTRFRWQRGSKEAPELEGYQTSVEITFQVP